MKNNLLMRLICILCVTVLVCGVFSACQKPGNDPQATEEPTSDSTQEPTGDSTQEPTGDSTQEPTGGSNNTPEGGDSSIMDGDDHIQAPFD